MKSITHWTKVLEYLSTCTYKHRLFASFTRRGRVVEWAIGCTYPTPEDEKLCRLLSGAEGFHRTATAQRELEFRQIELSGMGVTVV